MWQHASRPKLQISGFTSGCVLLACIIACASLTFAQPTNTPLAQLSPSAAPPVENTPVENTPAIATNGSKSVTDQSDPVATYLEQQRLYEVLAAHLRARIQETAGVSRVILAERLGKLYARMLGQVPDAARRERLEQLSRDLMRDVPDADSSELRLNLAKASYLRVEEIAERTRLKLANDAETDEARIVLRTLGTTFIDLAKRLDTQVKLLERREATAHDQDLEDLRGKLSDTRRLHSLARYYAGWSNYYDALLNSSAPQALRAMEEFGVLLNAAPNQPATVDRVPKQLLRFEHIARAALGCALSASLRGEHVEAIRWIDLLNQADDLPLSVSEQIFTREILVYAAAQRWSDVEMRVRQRRGVESGTAIKRLTPVEARFVAVVALEYGGQAVRSPRLTEMAQGVAATAMSDLVSQKQIGQVLDLVQRFGTSSLGSDGFIVLYVRGIRAYEEARAAHREAPGNPDEPSKDAALVNMYQQAAGILESTLGAGDSKEFPAERVRTRTRAGLSKFYAGDFVNAVSAFTQAVEEATSVDLRRDALWYAIATLDYAIEQGAKSNVTERDRLAVVYLKEFPDSENAARLLMRQTSAQGMTDAQVVEVLLKLPPESPLYRAARRQASTILYKIYRRAKGNDRDFAALRFTQIAEELLRTEQTIALGGVDEAAKQAGNAVILRARQLADALLSVSGPDPDKAEACLVAIETVSAYQAIDTAQIHGEVQFRRLQIAVIRGDEAAITSFVDSLRGTGGTYADAADRLLFRRGQRLLVVSPNDARAARDVVRFGTRILEHMGGTSATAPTVRDAIAGAAAVIWEAEADVSMRALGLAMERDQAKAGVRTLVSLRRHAKLAEATGEIEEAGRAWSEISIGVDTASLAWFEARYESMRLLAKIDSNKARAALDQHEVLYPELGPLPWNEKFRALRQVLGVSPMNTNPPATSAIGTPN